MVQAYVDQEANQYKFHVCSITLGYFPINVWFSASEQAMRGRGKNNNNYCTI